MKSFLFILILTAVFLPQMTQAAVIAGRCTSCCASCTPPDTCVIGTCQAVAFFGSYCVDAGTLCLPNPLGSKNVADLVNKLTDFVFTLTLAVSPLMIALGALLLMTVGVEPKNLEKAKTIFKWTAVGLAVGFLGKGIVAALKGLF